MDEKIKYLKDGREVVVLERCQSGFIVREVYEPEYGALDGDERDHGDPILVPKVYGNPPTGKLAVEAKQLNLEIETLSNHRDELLREVENAKKERDRIMTKLKTVHQLKNLEDFIGGNVTHYIQDIYYSPEIIEFGDAKSDFNKFEQKLLTLFGKSNGNLAFKLNQYSDGSGRNHEVFPCLSYEDAIEKLKIFLQDRFKEKPHVGIIESCKKYGIPVPPEYMLEWKKKELGNLEAKKVETQKQVDAITAKIAELNEGE